MLFLHTDPLPPRFLDLFELPFSCLVSYVESSEHIVNTDDLTVPYQKQFIDRMRYDHVGNVSRHTYMYILTHIHTYISTTIFLYA